MQRGVQLVIAFLLSSLGVQAQYQVAVEFTDSNSKAIEGVYVSIVNLPDRQAYSGTEGRVNFNLAEGTHTLQVQRIGYEASEYSFSCFSDTLIEITLQSIATQLPFVEVSAFSLTEQTDVIGTESSSSYFLSSTSLDQLKQTDMNQVLNRIPGVQIQEEEGFGLRPNIGIRGSGSLRSEKVLLLEDGILTAPAPYAAPAAYYSPTFGRMSGLEVKLGSASLTAGPYTTGGAINFLSVPIPNQSMTSARVGLGSFGTQQTLFTVGDQIGDFGFVAQFFRQSSNGFKELPNNGDTGHRKWDGLLKARYLLSDKDGHRHQLSLKFLHTQETSAETYLGLTKADFTQSPFRRYAASERDEMNTEFTGGHLQYAWIFPDQKSWITTVYGHHFFRNWYKLDKTQINGTTQSISTVLNQEEAYPDAYSLLTGNATEGNLLLKANNRNYYTYGLQSELKAQWAQHRLKAGLRLHADGIDRFQWIDRYQMGLQSMMLVEQGEPGTESNRLQDARVASAYADYSWSWNKLSLSAGARVEYLTLSRRDYGKEDPERTGLDVRSRSNELFAFIPGISAQYQWSEHFSVYSSVVKGYSPPGSNPDTRPEESVNSELGLRFRKSNIQLQLVGFWHEYQRLLGSSLLASGDPSLEEMVNGGSARSFGIEWYAKFQAHKNWPLEMSYTFISSRFTEEFESDFDPWGTVQEGDFLPYVAPHTLWFQTGYQSDRWAIFTQIHYQTDMLSQAGSLQDQNLLIGSRWLLSLQLQYQVNHRLAVYARGNNLLDQRYAVATRPAGWRSGMPRYGELGLEFNL